MEGSSGEMASAAVMKIIGKTHDFKRKYRDVLRKVEGEYDKMLGDPVPPYEVAACKEQLDHIALTKERLEEYHSELSATLKVLEGAHRSLTALPHDVQPLFCS
jgi:hypothetical protein